MTGEVETHAQNSIRGHWRRIAGGPNNGIGVSIGSAALAEFGHSHRQRMRRWKVPRAGRRMSPFRLRPLSGRRPGFLCQGSRMWGWTVPRAGRRVPCFRSWTLSARLFWPLSLIGLGVVRRSPPASLRRDNLAPVGHDPNSLNKRKRQALFDHFVRAGENGRRHVKTELLRGPEVDHQLVLGWRLHR